MTPDPSALEPTLLGFLVFIVLPMLVIGWFERRGRRRRELRSRFAQRRFTR